MEKVLVGIGFLVVLLFVCVGLDLVFAWPAKWCWNYVVPHILGLPAIGYWQAFALLVLGHLLWNRPHANRKD